MKRCFKRIFGALLTICVLLSAVSFGAFAGVTDVTGGSGVTVKTTVRNNYTVMGELKIDETDESEFYKSDDSNIFIDDEEGAEAYGKKIMEWLVLRGASWSSITTTKTKTGSKLTYTGTDYNDGDITIGDPDDIFGNSQGHVTINEIRDDYYLIMYTAVIHMPKEISSVDIVNAKLDFADGDTVSFTGASSGAGYKVSYEYWELMEKTDNGVEPVAFAYSDESKYTAATPRFDKFEAGKSYIYSVCVTADDGYEFKDDAEFTLNSEKPKYGTYHVSADGKQLFAAAVFSFKPDSSVMRGDVNGDGKITAKDARLALRIAARLESADDRMIKAGDLDGNGRISPSEARKILRYVARLENTL